jgi:type IV pilus assembly protein PilB
VRRKIGECLIQAGLITPEDLQIALAEQSRSGERLGAILVRLNYATEKQITKALAYQLGLAYVSLAESPPEIAAIPAIPKEVASVRLCVATAVAADVLTVAIADPPSFGTGQDLELQTGFRIKYVMATRSEILDCIDKGYRHTRTSRQPRQESRPEREADRGCGCVSCSRLLQPGWSFCPFCAAPAPAI